MPGVRALVPAHRPRRAHRGSDAALPLRRPDRARDPGGAARGRRAHRGGARGAAVRRRAHDADGHAHRRGDRRHARRHPGRGLPSRPGRAGRRARARSASGSSASRRRFGQPRHRRAAARAGASCPTTRRCAVSTCRASSSSTPSQPRVQGITLAPRFAARSASSAWCASPTTAALTAGGLARLPLVVEEGVVIELGQVARIEEEPTPAMIRRKNGQRRLGFNVRTEGDLGGTASRVERAMREIELPEGATVGISGKVEEARATPAPPAGRERASRWSSCCCCSAARSAAGARWPIVRRHAAGGVRRRALRALRSPARPGTRARSSA